MYYYGLLQIVSRDTHVLRISDTATRKTATSARILAASVVDSFGAGV